MSESDSGYDQTELDRPRVSERGILIRLAVAAVAVLALMIVNLVFG